jgi:aminoglycoside phosphotransferase (APT) family kinase protein
MPSTADRLTDFGPLTGAHLVANELDALLARAAADPVLVAGGADAAGPVEVRRDLRVAPDASGRPAIARFYWCAKWRDADGRFRARLFLHEPARGPTATYDFPADPRLPAAAAPRGPLDAPGVVVLRYIPTRRITFRRGDALVGKLKRRGTLERSYAILRAMHAAAGGGASFAVPEPLGIDAARGVFYQQRMRGRSVAELIDPGNACELMRRVGALHAAVHTLPVEAVRLRPSAEHVAAARADAEWVAFALPGEAGAVAAVERHLVSELEALGTGAPAFCHGDPAIDHVLLDGDKACVVDFDDAAIGDPYADLGAMAAGLRIDARGLSRGTGAAEAAYLEGYREATGRAHDERRLRAHLLRARLAILANRLRKGRLSAAEAVEAVADLQAEARS